MSDASDSDNALFDDSVGGLYTIDLNTAGLNDGIQAAKRSTTTNLGRKSSVRSEKVNVAAATVYVGGDDSNDESVCRITTAGSDEGDWGNEDTSAFRWIHHKTDEITFGHFEHLVMNAALEHHQNMIPVIVYLLKKIKRNSIVDSPNGSFINPGTVTRCDGTDRNEPGNPDLTAMFISIPYFDISNGKPPELPKDLSSHPTRGLYQYFYSQEAALNRERDQIFRKLRGVGPNQHLLVPQLWILILNSKTIITCGRASLRELQGDSIEIIDGNKKHDNERMVRVTDFLKRTVYFPIKQCQTYFQLRDCIEQKCLKDTDCPIEECILHNGNSEEAMSAAQWPRILAQRRSLFIYVRITRKAAAVVNPESTGPNIPNTPRRNLPVEYKSLSSDGESSDEDTSAADETVYGGSKALVVHPRRYHERHGHHSSSPVINSEEQVKNLREKGYVVNNVESLATKKTLGSSGMPKPKVFKRPQQATQERKAVISTHKRDISGEDTKEKPKDDIKMPAAKPSLDDGTKNVLEDLNDEGLISRSSSIHSSEDDERSQRASRREDDQFTRRVKNDEQSQKDSSIEEDAIERGSTTLSSREDGLSEYDDSVEIEALDAGGSSSGSKEYPEREKVESTASGQSSERGTPKFRSGSDDDDEEDATSLDPVELDLKKIIRDEINAVLRKNDANEEKTLERVKQEFRRKLSKAGYQDHQIDAMWNESPVPPPNVPPHNPMFGPEHPNNTNRRPDNRPTYVKVHRDHLDVETLHYYAFPYEIDRTDPNYIIILQELNEDETEVLFDHTRRLRGMKPHDFSQGPRPMPQKKDRSRPFHRSKSFVLNERLPPMTLAEIKSLSKVPPFLAWPTTVAESEKMASENVPDRLRWQPNEYDDTMIQLTLLAIEKRMSKVRRGANELPVSKWHPFALNYRSGRAFSNVRDLLTSDLPWFDASRYLNGLIHDMGLLKCQAEIDFIYNNIDSGEYDAKIRTGIDKDSGRIPSSVEADLPRRSLRWQISTLLNETDSFMTCARRLIEQFVPTQYPHPVLKRCWGALDQINKVMTEIIQRGNENQAETPINAFQTPYVIREVPGKLFTQFYELKDLPHPVDDCPICRRGKVYPNVEEAMQHLKDYHIDETEPPRGDERKYFTHWIVSVPDSNAEEGISKMLAVVKAIRQNAIKLLRRALEIRSGVANEQMQKSRYFLLPSDLVKAAEYAFKFIYTSAITLESLSEEIKKIPSDKIKHLDINGEIRLVGHFASFAGNAIADAQNELLLMAHTGSSDGSSIVRYTSIPPETIVFSLLIGLTQVCVANEREVFELYKDYLTSLRYQAGQSPSKKALREVFLFEEELEIVRKVYFDQFKAMRRIDRMLDDKSFRIASLVRVNSFRKIETPTLSTFYDGVKIVAMTLEVLRNQTEKTSQILRYNIEIAEEGHSKAILVFTLVTIIFLPLSFVSSLFGMNTSDIRDIDRTQALFWQIALPLTAAIGGISLLVAYKGSQIKEGIIGLRHKIGTTSIVQRSSGRQRFRERDEEKDFRVSELALDTLQNHKMAEKRKPLRRGTIRSTSPMRTVESITFTTPSGKIGRL